MTLLTVSEETLSKIRHLPSKSAVNGREGRLLAQLAARVPENGVIVEIGSCTGISTCYLATGSKSSVQVYAVDVWTSGSGVLSTQAIETTFKANISEMGLDSRVTMMKGTSQAIGVVWDKLIDLLFIDGDHSYEGVRTDYIIWSSLLRKGGTVVFHDWDRPDTVGRFIREIRKDLKESLFVEKVWSAIKP